MKVVENILELVGRTPMVRLRRLEQASGVESCAEIWAKLEYLNPGGSIKDRAALGIVLDAERRGVLLPGDTIVEATAGNTGVARFFKKKRAGILTVAVEPQGSVLEGGEPGPHEVEGIGVSFIPATFDRSVCDRVMKVMDEPAFAMVKRLAAEEGVFAGSSAGAMLCAAVDVAKELGAGKRVVTVIPDSAERYLSKGLLE